MAVRKGFGIGMVLIIGIVIGLLIGLSYNLQSTYDDGYLNGRVEGWRESGEFVHIEIKKRKERI